jgi:hypothetical protein
MSVAVVPFPLTSALVRICTIGAISVALIQCGRSSVKRKESSPSPRPIPAERVQAKLANPIAKRNNSANFELMVGGNKVYGYRYKFGTAAQIRCTDEHGYSAEQKVSQPINLQMAESQQGDVRLCLLGKNQDGIWQPIHDATQVEWFTDTMPPSEFLVHPPSAVRESNSSFEFQWTEARDATNVVYEGRIAFQNDRTCKKPVFTFQSNETRYQMDRRLSSGRYTFCVFAKDEFQHHRLSTISDNDFFVIAPELHITYFTGVPDPTVLRHARRMANSGEWLNAKFELSYPKRFVGRASTELDTHASPRFSFQVADPSSTDWPWAIAHAEVMGREIKTEILATGTGLMRHPILSSLAIDNLNRSSISLVSISENDPQLNLVEASRDGVSGWQYHNPSLPLATGLFFDLASAIDHQNNRHMVVVGMSGLSHRRSSEQDWLDNQPIMDPDCQVIDHVALEIDINQTLHIVYNCSTESQAVSQCTIKHGQNSTPNWPTAAWDISTVAIADTKNSCLPFETNRPSLAVDRLGRVHVAFRNSIEKEDGTSFAIAHAHGVSAGPWMAANILEAKHGLTHPSITVDGNGVVYVAFVQDYQLSLATKEGNADWIFEKIPTTPSIPPSASEPVTIEQVHSISELVLAGFDGPSNL